MTPLSCSLRFACQERGCQTFTQRKFCLVFGNYKLLRLIVSPQKRWVGPGDLWRSREASKGGAEAFKPRKAIRSWSVDAAAPAANWHRPKRCHTCSDSQSKPRFHASSVPICATAPTGLGALRNQCISYAAHNDSKTISRHSRS